MSVFLSYASTDKKFAERLKDELGKSGLSVWADSGLTSGEEWRRRIEDAIRSASEILVLVGPKQDDDFLQQLTWRAALEAVWQDSDKRLIPVLLRGADLPPFVLSGTSGKLEAIRVDDPRDMRSTAQAILELIRGHRTDDSGGRGATIFSVSTEADGGREERLFAIGKFAEQLRSVY